MSENCTVLEFEEKNIKLQVENCEILLATKFWPTQSNHLWNVLLKMSKHYACFEAIVVFFINIGVFKACVEVFWFFHQMIALQMIDLSSYWNYNKNVPHHLSKGEFVALQNLCKNKNIIQKSNEDNSDNQSTKQII